MPSKKYNGNTPLGSSRLGSLSDVELEVAKRTPKQAMTTGVVQTHNGTFHTPKRRQRATTSSSGCIPWKPRIIDERVEGADDPDYKLYLNAGTVNGVISATWNASVDFPTPPAEGDPPVKFIVLKLTFSQGQLNAITYELASSIPAAADLDPIGRNALPDTLSIIIGTVVGLQPCMIYNKNLSVDSVDVFHERLTGISLGEQPFYVWYKYATRVVE